MFNGASNHPPSIPSESLGLIHDVDIVDGEVHPEVAYFDSETGEPVLPRLPAWLRRRDAIALDAPQEGVPRLGAWRQDPALSGLSDTNPLSLPAQPMPLQACMRDVPMAAPEGLPALTPMAFQQVLVCLREWGAFGRCLPRLDRPGPECTGRGLNLTARLRVESEMSARRQQAVEVGALLMDWAAASDSDSQRLVAQLKGCSTDDAVDAVAAMVEASMMAFDVDQASPTLRRLCDVCRASRVNGEAVVRSLDAIEGINERGYQVIRQAAHTLRWRHVGERLPQLTQAMLAALGQPVSALPSISSEPPPIPPRQSSP